MKTNKKTSRYILAGLALSLGLSLVAGSGIASAAPKSIGVEKAKYIALKNAGLKAKNVAFVTAKLDTDDGRRVYDVEFYSNGVEYDYEIDAASGKIPEKDTDIENYSIPQKNAQKKASSKSGSSIGVEKAKSIALKNAGLKAKNVAFVRAKLDSDDGRQVYDIEFYSNGVEYDYEIDAISGAILEKDTDIEDYTIPQKSTQKKSSNSGSGIGLEKAKSIALNKAGLKASQVNFIKAHADYDDGVSVYDIEFYSNGKEYNFEIDAASGTIREYDVDIDD